MALWTRNASVSQGFELDERLLRHAVDVSGLKGLATQGDVEGGAKRGWAVSERFGTGSTACFPGLRMEFREGKEGGTPWNTLKK